MFHKLDQVILPNLQCGIEREQLPNQGLIIPPYREMSEYHDKHRVGSHDANRALVFMALPNDDNLQTQKQDRIKSKYGSDQNAQSQASKGGPDKNEQNDTGPQCDLQRYEQRLSKQNPHEKQKMESQAEQIAHDAQCNFRDSMADDTAANHHRIPLAAGSHLELDMDGFSIAQPPYRHIKMLGHGGSASVEMVEDINNGAVYARKIVRNNYTRNLKEEMKMLHNEVQSMKRIQNHRHIIKVHASYIAKRDLAILLSPVADSGDLASYLQDRRDTLTAGGLLKPDETLQRSFGCLASGLAYIHSQTIRHKDIQPQNILIHRGEVLFTDFGISYDFGDAGQSTTTGPV